ncbi:MAG TPA: hypothetical protein VIY48_13370, partial [Candidatus Paceibacterota bacterium]
MPRIQQPQCFGAYRSGQVEAERDCPSCHYFLACMDESKNGLRGAKTAPAILEEAAATYRERNKLYGDNYKHFGEAMSALFPNGLTIATVDEWNRLGIFVQLVSKAGRYANNFNIGGHVDSAHDACVYAAMLEELTRG